MQSRNGFSLMSEPDRLSIGSAASLGSTRKDLALLRNVRVEGRHKHITRALVRHIRWKTDYNWILCGLNFNTTSKSSYTFGTVGLKKALSFALSVAQPGSFQTDYRNERFISGRNR